MKNVNEGSVINVLYRSIMNYLVMSVWKKSLTKHQVQVHQLPIVPHNNNYTIYRLIDFFVTQRTRKLELTRPPSLPFHTYTHTFINKKRAFFICEFLLCIYIMSNELQLLGKTKTIIRRKRLNCSV